MQFYAKDIMSQKPITARPEMTVEELQELFTINRISGAPVVDTNGVVIGVITVNDILKAGINLPYVSGFFEDINIDRILAEEGLLVESFTEGFVSDFMTRNVFTAYPETPVNELAQIMYENRIHRVIIVKPNEQKPLGVVTTFDLLKLMAGKGALPESGSEKATEYV